MPSSTKAEPAPRGRPRDPVLETEILESALKLVAERGYENVSMEAVAAACGAGRASLYRRWPSKGAMIAEALRRSHREIHLEDTGSLRGDLLTCLREMVADEGRTGDLMAGLINAMRGEPELAEELRAALVESRREAAREWTERCIEQGQLRKGVDPELIGEIVPALISFRTLVSGGELDDGFCERVVDGVLLPILAPHLGHDPS
jgi:AcrR family transcriptional regulator